MASDATIVRELECKLSTKEWRDRARRLAQSPVERAEIETEAKRVANEFKTRIGKLEEEERRLAREVREGTTFRDVICHEVDNFAQNTIELRRNDTDEVVEQRAMTYDDRQAALDLSESEQAEPENDTDSDLDDEPEEGDAGE